MGPNPQFPADLITFTEKILNGKLHFFEVILFALTTNAISELFLGFSVLKRLKTKWDDLVYKSRRDWKNWFFKHSQRSEDKKEAN